MRSFLLFTRTCAKKLFETFFVCFIKKSPKSYNFITFNTFNCDKNWQAFKKRLFILSNQDVDYHKHYSLIKFTVFFLKVFFYVDCSKRTNWELNYFSLSCEFVSKVKGEKVIYLMDFLCLKRKIKKCKFD